VRARTPDGQSCSIGFASWQPPELLEGTITRADAALYDAKGRGRDQVAVAPGG
jgi:PleD family two-component response regulator